MNLEEMTLEEKIEFLIEKRQKEILECFCVSQEYININPSTTALANAHKAICEDLILKRFNQLMVKAKMVDTSPIVIEKDL